MIPKQTEYKVGMYLRLSNEDERAGESLSIENQRKILSNYISEQGWTLYDEPSEGDSHLLQAHRQRA